MGCPDFAALQHGCSTSLHSQWNLQVFPRRASMVASMCLSSIATSAQPDISSALSMQYLEDVNGTLAQRC